MLQLFAILIFISNIQAHTKTHTFQSENNLISYLASKNIEFSQLECLQKMFQYINNKKKDSNNNSNLIKNLYTFNQRTLAKNRVKKESFLDKKKKQTEIFNQKHINYLDKKIRNNEIYILVIFLHLLECLENTELSPVYWDYLISILNDRIHAYINQQNKHKNNIIFEGINACHSILFLLYSGFVFIEAPVSPTSSNFTPISELSENLDDKETQSFDDTDWEELMEE